MLHRVRLWDSRTPNGVDHFIANSDFIARRVWKVYRREAEVIYPPVDTSSFELQAQKEDFYFTASRMVPYKKIDLIVQAFARLPEKKLVVIGEGPDLNKIRSFAEPNITLMGYQPFEVLRDHMQRAKAFVFAAEEDFGIVPVEAQACGTPVIAFGKGGVLETVKGLDTKNPTGVFYESQEVPLLIDAVKHFEANSERFDAGKIRSHALTFNQEHFKENLKRFVEARYEERKR